MTAQRSTGDHRVGASAVGAANFAFHSEGAAWRVVGDVDCAVEIALRTALDAAGARVFVDVAHQLDAPRRLVLRGLSATPRKVFRLTGWDGTANLVIEDAR